MEQRSLVRLAAVMISLVAGWSYAAVPTTGPSVVDVKEYGAKGDGVTDDTAAFQAAMDAMGEAGGGVVHAGRGTYLFKGTLSVPGAVTLAGVWESVPAHNGIRDQGMPKPTDDGTTLLATAGRGSEEGTPFVTLNTNSTIKGVVIYYPEQDPKVTPVAYPYAIAMRGKNPSVIDCELLNPYNGIDASQNERHYIRNVQGQPLRRGIWVDFIYDIGRIENVHWNPWWSQSPAVTKFQMENGEGFVFAKADWEYVFNTFCYGYNVGYHFVASKSGNCNGNFLGIGADDCYTSLQADSASIIGLQITNGEFVSFKGPNPTMVRTAATNEGVVRFVNCNFWGPCNQIAELGGGTTGFSDCTFVHWDAKNKGRAAIQASGGSVIVRGCEFEADHAQVELGEGVKRAVISGNVITGEQRIVNKSKGAVVIEGNAAGPAK